MSRASKQRITEEDQAELAAARAALEYIAIMGDRETGLPAVRVAQYVLGYRVNAGGDAGALALWPLADARKQGTVDGA